MKYTFSSREIILEMLKTIKYRGHVDVNATWHVYDTAEDNELTIEIKERKNE